MQLMRGLFAKRGLPDGTAVDLNMAQSPLPATVWARPGAGDTVTISYSTDGGVSWNVWGPGAVTAYAESIFDSGVTHIRGQRTAGSGAASEYGVC